MVSSNPAQDNPGFGALSHVTKDNVYMMGRRGFIYTAPWVNTHCIRPPSASIALSADNRPFRLTINEQEWITRAAVIPPFVSRSLYARGVPLVCFHIMPSSPHYGAFNYSTHDNSPVLDRTCFDGLNEELGALYHGDLPKDEASNTYDTAVRLAMQTLPVKAPMDPRALQIRDLLESSPELTLTQLACKLGVSYYWTSRVVTDVFGMSLRDYKGWQKQQRVFSLLHSNRSITEIAYSAGFTDSAHLSRTYQRWFGQPPSYSRNRNHVSVFRC